MYAPPNPTSTWIIRLGIDPRCAKCQDVYPRLKQNFYHFALIPVVYLAYSDGRGWNTDLVYTIFEQDDMRTCFVDLILPILYWLTNVYG